MRHQRHRVRRWDYHQTVNMACRLLPCHIKNKCILPGFPSPTNLHVSLKWNEIGLFNCGTPTLPQCSFFQKTVLFILNKLTNFSVCIFRYFSHGLNEFFKWREFPQPVFFVHWVKCPMLKLKVVVHKYQALSYRHKFSYVHFVFAEEVLHHSTISFFHFKLFPFSCWAKMLIMMYRCKRWQEKSTVVRCYVRYISCTGLSCLESQRRSHRDVAKKMHSIWEWGEYVSVAQRSINYFLSMGSNV